MMAKTDSMIPGASDYEASNDLIRIFFLFFLLTVTRDMNITLYK